MQPDLEDLKITSRELDKLTGLDISDAFMGRAVRPSLFRHPKRLFSFLVTELLTLGLLLILCLPVALVLARSVGGNLDRTWQFLLVAVVVAIGLFVLWNGYIWQQGQSLKTLAHLLDQVDQYNEMLEAVHILDELGTVKHSGVELGDREEVLLALSATRESLICALMTEKILRRHKRFIARRQELFAQIETNLATLQTLQISPQASEYGQLLNQALQIGMSIRREMGQMDQ